MLDRVIAQIVLGLLSYLEKRMERGSLAVDADVDRDRLRRGGARIRAWLRKQGGVHPGSKPGAPGSGDQGTGVDAG
jgi:hypothetical protein